MNTKAPECWASDASAKAVRIEISAEKFLLLKFDHLIYAEFEHVDAEQRLHLHFATHEVTVRGYALRRIEGALQRLELSYICAVPEACRLAIVVGQPVVLEILVKKILDDAQEAPTNSVDKR